MTNRINRRSLHYAAPVGMTILLHNGELSRPIIDFKTELSSRPERSVVEGPAVNAICHGAPVLGYGTGREKFRLKIRRRGKCFPLAECNSGTSPDSEGKPLVAREMAGDDENDFHQDHR